jgi:hypothetical protein
MANTVKFTNTSGQALYVEAGEKNNLLDFHADVFENGFDGYPELGLLDTYGMFFPEGDVSKKPIVYFRHSDAAKGKHRFGNFTDIGDDYLDVQKGVYHEEEVAQADTPFINYHKISEEPLVYGYGSEEKKVSVQYHENHISIEEGSFFNVKAYPWPVTWYDHQSVYLSSSTVFQPVTYAGTFDGKPVVGLGSCDRMYFKHAGGFDNVPLGYIAFSGMGIRSDGRKESVFVSISLNEVGKTLGMYYLEGEQPIITDTVSVEADWMHLPYVNDGTCVFKDATFYISDKVINFKGQWGSKGFGAKPRIEKHGQSQMFGTWYEGSAPYQHRLYFSFVENMDAYDTKLEQLGFKVLK